MTHITCRLTAENRDQLRNPTLGNQVRATFTFTFYLYVLIPWHLVLAAVRCWCTDTDGAVVSGLEPISYEETLNYLLESDLLEKHEVDLYNFLFCQISLLLIYCTNAIY